MSTRQIPILMYHSISSSAHRRFRKFAVAPNLFASHLAYLDQHGYHTVTVSQLASALSGTFKLPARPVVLTFDDGFADFYTEAFPRLRRYGFVATLYVVTGFAGETSRWLEHEHEGKRPMISWKQLADIAASGIECGGHSHTHVPLDTLSPFAAYHETLQCKQLLEDHLGRAITSFAYPYGYFNATVRQLVQTVGYTSACAVKYTRNGSNSDPFALGRYIVPADTPVSTFGQLLSGEPMTQFFNRVRAIAWSFMRQRVLPLKKHPHGEIPHGEIRTA